MDPFLSCGSFTYRRRWRLDVGAVNPSLSVLNATVPWSLPSSLFRVEPNATTAMTTMTAVATIRIRMI